MHSDILTYWYTVEGAPCKNLPVIDVRTRGATIVRVHEVARSLNNQISEHYLRNNKICIYHKWWDITSLSAFSSARYRQNPIWSIFTCKLSLVHSLLHICQDKCLTLISNFICLVDPQIFIVANLSVSLASPVLLRQTNNHLRQIIIWDRTD